LQNSQNEPRGHTHQLFTHAGYRPRSKEETKACVPTSPV
jgi:hypothetical protein